MEQKNLKVSKISALKMALIKLYVNKDFTIIFKIIIGWKTPKSQ